MMKKLPPHEPTRKPHVTLHIERERESVRDNKMFILRDWLSGYSKKQSVYDDDDADNDDETEELPTQRHERVSNNEPEEEDGDWGVMGEYDEMDDVFFNDLERAHRFNQGELRSFYNTVREAYLYELPSTATHNTRRDINQFIHNFLGYLINGNQQQPPSEKDVNIVGIDEDKHIVPTMRRTYPRLIYMNYINNGEYAQSLAPYEIGVGGGAFRVDRRLDFVYAYVIEKGIIDTLRYRGEQISQHQQDGDYRFIEEILDEIDTYKDIYRMRVNSQYINQSESTTTLDRLSDSWVIYTQRSSAFFGNCIDSVNRGSTDGLIYSDKTLRIEPVPFQQVLLLCGGFPGFLEKHTCELQKEGPVTVNVKEADDWVSVPIWFSLLSK